MRSLLTKRASILLVSGALVASLTATLPLGSAPAASAASFNLSVAADGMPGMVGVDAIYSGGAGAGGDYDDFEWWDTNGRMLSALSVRDVDAAGRSLSQMRYELYPKPTPRTNENTYDPWTVDVGGAHVQVDRGAAGWGGIGTVLLPRIGDQYGGFRADGAIVSSSPVPDGRVSIDVFQQPYNYPDVGPTLPRTTAGAEMAAFATASNREKRWTAGVTWPGTYIVFVRDSTNGTEIAAFTEIYPGRVPTVDLDATCFGFDTCNYVSGGPAASPGGGFHTLSPTRILDTRIGLGIGNGPISPGDGRIREPDPLIRRDMVANHELKVTGKYGIPESGVSAVLLNVTASQPTETSWLSLFPKPPRGANIYDDQSSYGAVPTTSNLNLLPYVDVPNMVVAPVGAGGKIRIFNWAGTTHLIADVAGWIDSTGTMNGGSAFTGVSPTRVMDTRLGQGGTTFSTGEERTIDVVDEGGVPAGATSVVLNITGANAAGVGWAAAYPTGEARPTVSNINMSPGRTRANLAVVKVGAGGKIQLMVAETSADVIVDVYGYYAPNGGMMRPISPQRIADTRATGPLGPHETRRFAVAGLGGVPANATGVIMNLTAVTPTSDGYLTVWPAGTKQPTASNVNFTGGQDVPNLVMVGLQGGAVDIFNELGNTHVLLDVVAYVT